MYVNRKKEICKSTENNQFLSLSDELGVYHIREKRILALYFAHSVRDIQIFKKQIIAPSQTIILSLYLDVDLLAVRCLSQFQYLFLKYVRTGNEFK